MSVVFDTDINAIKAIAPTETAKHFLIHLEIKKVTEEPEEAATETDRLLIELSVSNGHTV